MKSRRVRILSPAKINLFLEVVCRRPDGFHEIKTLLQAVDLCDELILEPISRGVRLTTHCAELPVDRGNLIVRAAESFLRENKIRSGVAISLKKSIPIAAGLGGGSSNAACTFLGLEKLFETGQSLGDLAESAAELGSDVPFFLSGRPSVGIGKGHEIIALGKYLPFWVVLAGPVGTPQSNKTAHVYKSLKLGLTEGPRPITITLAAIETKSIKSLSGSLFNRLENVVLDWAPLARPFKEFMLSQGALGALVSGAGPTVFGIVPDKAQGLALEKKIRNRFGPAAWVRVVKTLPRTPGPKQF